MRATRLIATALAWTGLVGTLLGQAPMIEPAESPAAPAAPTATTVLTAPPNSPSYPNGTVFSPACPDGSCCGPFGANGPITYELFSRTGPSLVVGGSELSGRLNTGWQVGGGANTLFFNKARDAAWVLTTGVSYTYNRGRQERGGPLPVITPPINRATGADGQFDYLVRGVHRTSFDFGFGRDWWLSGPGNVGSDCKHNGRVGVDVGGRWGTSHSDLVLESDLDTYLRKQSVFHSVLIGTHANWERAMGNWILFAGIRGEFDYTFLDVVPTNGSDIVSVNFLFQLGVRY